MPERKTLQQARRDRRAGKSPSTQAGAFVREEIEHVRQGRHGVRSTRQAIAIGLSKARRAGIELAEPASAGTAKSKARKRSANRSDGKASSGKVDKHAASGKRAADGSRHAVGGRAEQQENPSAVSHRGLAQQGRAAANRRSAAARSASAKKAARTKGVEGRRAAAQKAARTRARNRR